MKAESAKVWKFIIEREIEAPARFQAIQTHRATMAIIRQQARCSTLTFPPACCGHCILRACNVSGHAVHRRGGESM